MSGLNFVGSPDFVPPTGARHSSSGARRSRRGSAATSIDALLPMIEEDHPSPPLPVEPPPKTHNRPFSQRFRSNPPRYSDKNGPPGYTLSDVIGPKGERFEDLRDNKFIARRGGWKKLCLIGAVVLIVVIALVVGLAVGVTMRKSSRCALKHLWFTPNLLLMNSAHLQLLTSIVKHYLPSQCNGAQKPLPGRLLDLHHLSLDRFHELHIEPSILDLLA